MASSPKGYGHRRSRKPFKLFPALLTLCLILIVYQRTKEQFLSIIIILQSSDGRHLLNSNVAFATLLLPPDPSETNLTEAERYFTSTRILNYQLQHSRSTRSQAKVPFLVLTTPDVPEYQSRQLAHEGATIIPVPLVHVPDWIKPLHSIWRSLMTKLRLFELTTYSRILFLDADTFVLHPMDGIFSDPTSFPIKTSHTLITNNNDAPLPSTYLLASLPEALHPIHEYPPIAWRNFNAGFFLCSPSTTLFSHYISLLNSTDSFDPTYAEQSLLNYAHREGGNMPWQRLGGKNGEWNIDLPNMNDVRKGVRSVHAKLWWEGTELHQNEMELTRRWEDVRTEMENFYKDKDRDG
jgi:alpha-N-acetylglucosamine transferase